MDIWTFLTDPYYLGNATSNSVDIYPVWRKALEEMFNDNTKLLVILTGSIGTGKSTIALWALIYIQYRLMILKEPWKFFGLADSGKMTISFFNLNKTLGDSRGYKKFQYFISKSPWFRKNAFYISDTKAGDILEFKMIKYVLASPFAQGFGVVGEDVIAGILDELDSPMTANSQKLRVIETYNSTVIRFKTRFAPTGYSLGKLFLVSSKQGELSFIDSFITERKSSSEVLIYDVPLWDAKPKHNFSGVTFPIAIGDAFNPPKIIQQTEIKEYVKNGYQIISPPIEFKKEFEIDLIRSLRDIAGVTVAGIRKFKLFPSEKLILECIDDTKIDPVKIPTIPIGLKDEFDLVWFLDISKFRLDKSIPRYIHFDIAISGDAATISMAGIKEWIDVDKQNPDGTFRKETASVIETDFVMRIKAKDGDRIPIHKLRKLVLDIKANGINLHKFSADLVLASEDTRQLLQAAGVETEYISVDKTLQPYYDFRNLVYEKRWICHRRPRLIFELKYLEQIDGKVDHPLRVTDIEILEEGGIKEIAMEGTKDEADAVVGAVTQCLKYSTQPMNAKLMTDMINKTTDNPDKEDVSKLFKITDSKGDEITGTKDGNHVNKINDIFSRFHNG